MASSSQFCGKGRILRIQKISPPVTPQLAGAFSKRVITPLLQNQRAYKTTIRYQGRSPFNKRILFSIAIGTGVWMGYEYGKHNTGYPGTANLPTFAASRQSCVAHLKDQAPPQWNLSPENIAGARAEFVKLLGPEGINDDLATRIAHSSTPWSEAPNGDADRGSLIVYPTSTNEVSEIARICHKRRIPMIPYSGGTSLESTLAAIHGEIYVDFRKMKKIIRINEQDMDVVVQPGISYNELNDILDDRRLYFPPDPGPGAQIGGMIAQGCSGTNAFRYGTMKDWVLGLTVVLADGTIIKTRGRPRKSSAGYDLTHLIVGSEGTLGFVTEASLKLASKPENIKVGVASFPDIHSAIRTSVNIVRSGHMLEAMELLDDMAMRSVNMSGYGSKQWPEQTTLFFKFSGSPANVAEQIEAVEGFVKEQSSSRFTISSDAAEAESLWTARKTALWNIMALKKDPSDSFISADICVPISRLGDIIAATKESCEISGFVATCLGHVGDGNFHAGVFFPEKDREKARGLMQQAQKLGIAMDGTVTGEHGIGLVNRDALDWELGENSVATMRQIKLALDPLCLMNPGKVFKLWAGQQ